MSLNEDELTLADHLQPLGYRCVANGKMHLRPQCAPGFTLPDQSETTTNGTLPVGTIQGLSASLRWTFEDAQRASTTTNS